MSQSRVNKSKLLQCEAVWHPVKALVTQGGVSLLIHFLAA
jgi:hypothetical protein